MTDLSYKFKDPNSGLTEYLGVKSLPWVTDMTYHAFHLSIVNETVYFCTKCHELKWVTFEQTPLLINFPEGLTDRVYTDADFDGATCTNTKLNPIMFFNHFHLKNFF